MAHIKINDITPEIFYTATAGQTVFPYPFPIFEESDLVVTINGVTQALTTDYTVTGEGTDNGGDVTLLVGAALDDSIALRRSVPKSRTSDLPDSGAIIPKVLNDDYDRIVAMIQEVNQGLAKKFGFNLNVDDIGVIDIEADVDSRKGFYLGFSGAGDLTLLPASGDTGVVPQQSARQTGDGSTTSFNTPATEHVNPISLMVRIDGVLQRPDTDYTTTGTQVGKVEFTTPPLNGVSIDITYFEPNSINPGGFVTEAPVDGNSYVRKDSAWDLAISAFLGLSDTPSSYSGSASEVLAVNVGETGLEFIPIPGDSTKLPLAGGTMTGNLILAYLTEQVHTMTGAAVDATNGNWQKRTLTGNETLTFTLAAGQSVFVTVVPGANTLTLSNVDEWIGSSAPATIEAEHGFLFWSDDGVTITGNSLGGIS